MSERDLRAHHKFITLECIGVLTNRLYRLKRLKGPYAQAAANQLHALPATDAPVEISEALLRRRLQNVPS